MIDLIIQAIDTRSELISGGEFKMHMSVVDFPLDIPVYGKKIGTAKM